MCIPIPFQAPLKSQWRNKNEIWTHINKENESRDHSRWAISTKCWKMKSKRTSSERVGFAERRQLQAFTGRKPTRTRFKATTQLLLQIPRRDQVLEVCLWRLGGLTTKELGENLYKEKIHAPNHFPIPHTPRLPLPHPGREYEYKEFSREFKTEVW